MSVRPAISLREQVNVANSFHKIFPNQNNTTDGTKCSPLENIAFLHDLLKMKTIFFYLRGVKICGQFQFLNAHIGKVKKQKIGHHSSYLLEKSGQISAAGVCQHRPPSVLC
jgi:hypothetical protein